MSPLPPAAVLAVATLVGLAPVPAATEPRPLLSIRDAHVRAVEPGGEWIGLLVAGEAETRLRLATEISAVLGGDAGTRVLPVLTDGTSEPLRDVAALRGVDVAMVATDDLARMTARDGAAGRVVYLAKLHNEELHLLAGPGIGAIDDLAGKAVNVGPAGGGAETAAAVFAALGVEIEALRLRHAEALPMVASGEIAATVVLAGKPSPALARLHAGDLRLLPIPYVEALREAYLPALIGPADYPDLGIAPEGVETVAVGVLLAAGDAASGSERHRRLVGFVEAFFSRVEAFGAPGHHPKWRDVRLEAEVPGWTRFGPAAARAAVHRLLEGGRADAAGPGEARRRSAAHASPGPIGR